MVRSKTVSIVFVGVVLVAAGRVMAWDEPFFVELTAVDTQSSFNDEADWAWWKTDKYDGFLPEESQGFDLVQLRLERRTRDFNIFFAMERMPVLRADGLIAEPGLDGAARHELSLELEAYDLAVGRRFVTERRGGVTPWIGFTHLQLDERRLGLDSDGASLEQPVDTASSRLWGLAAGVDASFDLSGSWTATGRLVVRWAEGTRSARFVSPDLDGAAAEAATVEVSDSTTRAMYGAELGLRWTTYLNLQVEGGWWYRNWEYDHGPASFSGPFLRVIVGL